LALEYSDGLVGLEIIILKNVAVPACLPVADGGGIEL
jgi:hypothetical protein